MALFLWQNAVDGHDFAMEGRARYNHRIIVI
jgi:hypothetical protein